MIIVIDALNKDHFRDVLEDMYRLRSRVFGGRLGWDVKIEDGMEIDEFDHLDPAYVIGLDDEGNVVSCVRALQTTGPHMLADVFSSILDGEPPVRSATIWESTRFCVDTQRLGRGTAKNSVSYATCELMVGSLEYAQNAGITDIITVIDPIMDRVLKRSDNAPYGYIGSTKPMGKVSAMAALLDCSDERISRVRNFASIEGDVFATEEDVRALLDQKNGTAKKPALKVHSAADAAVALVKQKVTTSDMLAYCHDQISTARSDTEMHDALALVRELAKITRIPQLHNLIDDTK